MQKHKPKSSYYRLTFTWFSFILLLSAKGKSDLLSPFCGIIMLLHYESFSHNRRIMGLNLTIRNGTEIARGGKNPALWLLLYIGSHAPSTIKCAITAKSAVKANNGKMGKFIQLSRFIPDNRWSTSDNQRFIGYITCDPVSR